MYFQTGGEFTLIVVIHFYPDNAKLRQIRVPSRTYVNDLTLLPIQSRENQSLTNLVTFLRQVNIATRTALLLNCANLSLDTILYKCGYQLLWGLGGLILQKMIIKKFDILILDFKDLPVILPESNRYSNHKSLR